MTEDNFERAVKFVLKWEGGYSNDPADPGGETKYGISKRAFPMLDIKSLTLEEAKDVYFGQYWLKAGCGVLEWPLCLVVFDTAVNMGVSRARSLRGTAAGSSWTDYLLARLVHYNRLAADDVKLNKFLRGWINRVLDLYKTAKEA